MTNNYKKTIFALSRIHIEIEKFVKEIVKDAYKNVDDIHYKIGLDGPYYKIGLYNSKTKITVVKPYELMEFMDMCTKKKIEMELNLRVREMLLKTEGTKKGVIII